MALNGVLVSFLVSAVLFNDAVANITWTYTDQHLVNGSLTACAGSDVYLNWSFALNDSSEHEYNIDWILVMPNLTESYIASSSHGHLFDGNGKYEKTTNAGIKIVNVSKSDEGNYSVTVVTQTGRHLQSYPVDYNVYLHVNEPVKIAGKELLIEYGPGNQSDIILKCGHFLSVGNPPAIVNWTIGNHAQQAIAFENGYFHISQPLSGIENSYNCSVTSNPSSACQAPYASKSVTLNSLEVRLSLIEARLKKLESFHNIIVGGASATTCATTGCSQSDVEEVKAELATVTKDNDLLERRIQALDVMLHHLNNTTPAN